MQPEVTEKNIITWRVTDKMDYWREKNPRKWRKKEAETGHMASQSGTANQQSSIRKLRRGLVDWKVKCPSEYLWNDSLIEGFGHFG